MALSTEEEETIESLKRWWRESGRTLAVGIALAVLVFLGWQQWQSMRDNRAAEASALYEELSSLAIGSAAAGASEAEREQALSLAGQLKADYDGTTYAAYAALFAAQLAVEADDLQRAQSELEWVLDNAPGGWFSSPDDTLLATARLRLGRVLLARGNAAEALTVVSAAEAGALSGQFQELRGDIHRAQGQHDAALEAYRAAAAAGPGSPFLDMKINELAGA